MTAAPAIKAALAVLQAGTPAEKTKAAECALSALKTLDRLPAKADRIDLPIRPARPLRPVLSPPNAVPRRRLGSPEGRTALLHAIAHIEFNAIDLAFDMALRFFPEVAQEGLDSAEFFSDWVQIGAEEAAHFNLVQDRLAAYGAAYGDLPAHDGLWEAAEKTAGDLVARLVVAPMILEARGLDVTPGMAERLQAAGDQDSADALGVIYRDEIGHVACGRRWFHDICRSQDLDPDRTFQDRRRRFFAGALKPPFNQAARSAAGLERGWYERD